MSLPSRLTQLERRVAALQAKAAARRAEFARRFPTYFDYWFPMIQTGWREPEIIRDKHNARLAPRIARDLGVVYYEEGSDVLRAHLLKHPYNGNHRFSEAEAEHVLAWCRQVWCKGSPHPLAPSVASAWLDAEYGPLSPEQQAEVKARAQRFPQPFDVLAEETATAAAQAPISPPGPTFDAWLHGISRAWSSPLSIADPEQARRDLDIARKLGTLYYERGSEALRTCLRMLSFGGERPSEAQIEQMLAWCRRVWGKGSRHPWAPHEPSNWLAFTNNNRALPASAVRVLEERVRPFPAPADMLAAQEA